MKNLITALLFLATTISVFAQTTLTLRPGALAGKDAYFKDLTPTLNQGNHADFTALAWTNSTDPVTARSVVEFDLTSIPTGAVITGAYLSLYNNPTSSNNSGQHSNLSGSNEGVLRRVISSWSESSITWNNQPSATTINQVILPASVSVNQDYTNIDVTQLVQDMVDMPSASFGFMLSLQTEQNYRALIFASSDHTDTTKHPKLVVTYTIPNAINEWSSVANLIVYPNPSVNDITVELNNPEFENCALKLYDQIGKLVKTISIAQVGKVNIQREGLCSGIYFLKIEVKGELRGTAKIVFE